MTELIRKNVFSEGHPAPPDAQQRFAPHVPKRPEFRIEVPPPPPAPDFPVVPTRIEDTGLTAKFLGALLLKSLYLLGIETNAELAKHLKLSQLVADQLLGSLKQQGLVEVRGSAAANVPILRYGLTNAGRELAIDACKQCEYVGAAPVSLKAFQDQVLKQTIQGEQISVEDLCACLAHLVLPGRLIQRLGPAVNSARALLVYGPPGNGKTAISESIGNIFRQPVFVPHCFEVDGQVIRMFDPTVHAEVPSRRASDVADETNLLRKKPDPRWVKCRRPVVLTGGELTLDMLDLRYDRTSKFYEAPLQVKALGGLFIIDDFGRQMVQPMDLLNRWIIPLERRVDYLTIHTGKKFDIPFDELVIFSTNIHPEKLMDAALLRRVKYKFRIDPPSTDDFLLIFQRVCTHFGLELPDEILNYLMEDFYPRTGTGCAGFHPMFIVEHCIATCRYKGISPHLSLDLVKDALENLVISELPDHPADNPAAAVLQAKVS